MNKLQNVGKKIEGNAQQVKGKIEYAMGQRVKGTINKVAGKSKVVLATIENKLRK